MIPEKRSEQKPLLVDHAVLPLSMRCCVQNSRILQAHTTHHTCTWWASKHGNKTEQSGRGKGVNQSNMQEPGSGVRVRESVSVCVRKCVLHVKDAC